MSVVTPSDPASSRRLRGARERLTATLSGELVTAWSRLAIAAASARGRHHRVNEDSYSPFDGIAPVFVVADGVGGGAMAAWASRRLVSDVHRRLERRRIDADAVRRALLDADRDIARHIAHRSGNSGAATVAICAAVDALRSRWLIGWVGDCRVYRIAARGGASAELLTTDDTYRHLSEDPPPGGSPEDPARMIGNGAVSTPNVDRVRLRWDDLLVLASDGVHKFVAAEELARVLRHDAPLARRCLRIVELARANGSPDDATILVVHRGAQPRSRLLRYAGVVVAAIVAAALLVSWLKHAPQPSSAPPPIESESSP